MGIEQFLDGSPDDIARLDDATVTELSNLMPDEAIKLADAWQKWPADTLVDLLQRLSQLFIETAHVEFETVFTLALDHVDPRARRLGLAGLAESTDRMVALRMAELVRRDPDSSVRASAAANLALACQQAAEGRLIRRDGERLFEALCDAFENLQEPVEVRARALESVAAFGGDRVNRFIRTVYADRSIEMRQSAIVAMGRTGDPAFIDFAVMNLDHVRPEMRLEATNALGLLCDEVQADLLEGPLDDQDLEVQLAAVAALARIGGSDARRLLRGAERSPEPRVATAAKETMAILDEFEGLEQPVTPAMAKRGMYGAPIRSSADMTDEEYDAAAREGWGHLSEEGEDFGGEGSRQEEEDPFDTIIDFERPPDQADMDD